MVSVKPGTQAIKAEIATGWRLIAVGDMYTTVKLEFIAELRRLREANIKETCLAFLVPENPKDDPNEQADITLQMDLTKPMGVEINDLMTVSAVHSNGQAMTAGITVGCTLIRIGSVNIACLQDMMGTVAELKAGRTSSVDVTFTKPTAITSNPLYTLDANVKVPSTFETVVNCDTIEFKMDLKEKKIACVDVAFTKAKVELAQTLATAGNTLEASESDQIAGHINELTFNLIVAKPIGCNFSKGSLKVSTLFRLGQAEASGVVVGSKLLRVGSSNVLSTRELKNVLVKLKAEGVHVVDVAFSKPESSTLHAVGAASVKSNQFADRSFMRFTALPRNDEIVFRILVASPIGAELHEHSLIVNHVTPSSQAACGGVTVGCKLISVGAVGVSNLTELKNVLTDLKAKNIIEEDLLFKKGDALVDSQIPKNEISFDLIVSEPIGVDLEVDSLLVSSIYPLSQAAIGGVTVGSRLVRVGPTNVANRNDLQSAVGDIRSNGISSIEIVFKLPEAVIDDIASKHQKESPQEISSTTFDLYLSEGGVMATYDQVVSHEEELKHASKTNIVANATFDLYTSEDGFMGTYDEVVAHEEEMKQAQLKDSSEFISDKGEKLEPFSMFKKDVVDGAAATDIKENTLRIMFEESQLEIKTLQKTIEELRTSNVSEIEKDKKTISDLQERNASLSDAISSLNTSLQTLRTSFDGLTEPISPTVWASEPMTFELNLNCPLGADLGNSTLVVAVIQPHSQSALAGIKPGWKVTGVGEKTVSSIKEFTEELKNIRSKNLSKIQITFVKPDFEASLKQRK